MSVTNLVFILSDDQGQWAAGCYGNDDIHTPNLDRLAATGMRFDRCFCTSPVCSPSRASYLTGQIPSAHGVHDWIRDGNVPPDEEAAEPAWPAVPYLEDQATYSSVLAANGYDCALSGKWHLGDSMTPQAGYDRWFVHQRGGGPYYDAPVVRDGVREREPNYITDAITDEALSFLDDLAEPFHLSVQYTAPHSPWTADGNADGQHPPAITARYDDCPFKSCPQEPMHPDATGLTRANMGSHESIKGYFAAVTAMDRQIGRILDRLEDRGVRDRTLVVFTSDNGFSCGHHGFWGKGNGTFPMNMYEESVLVPCLASHPGRIPAGETTDAMVNGYDFFPTFLEYLLECVPDGYDGPGRSIVPVLEGTTSETDDRIVAHSEYGTVRMLRTDRWKYVHRYPYGPHQLFDLANDPEERTNLIEEPGHADRVAAMRAELADWFASYVDPDLDGSQFPVTGRGQHTRIDEETPGEGVFHPRD